MLKKKLKIIFAVVFLSVVGIFCLSSFVSINETGSYTHACVIDIVSPQHYSYSCTGQGTACYVTADCNPVN